MRRNNTVNDFSTIQKNILRGNIFIIPSPLQIFSDIGTFKYDVQNIKGPRVCLRGQIIDDDYNNLTNYHCEKIGKKISDKFPLDLFMGKKEGDTIELMINSKYIILTCSQKKSFEDANKTKPFEDLLYDLTQTFGGVCPETSFKPPFSKYKQKLMLIENHENYARSHNFAILDPETFKFAYPL